jgi:hypothetical protein
MVRKHLGKYVIILTILNKLDSNITIPFDGVSINIEYYLEGSDNSSTSFLFLRTETVLLTPSEG